MKTRLRDSIKLLIFHFASKLLYLHTYIRERLVYTINRNGSEIFTLLFFFQNELHFRKDEIFKIHTLHTHDLQSTIYHFYIGIFIFLKTPFAYSRDN